jgi:trk system potassium uptake protein
VDRGFTFLYRRGDKTSTLAIATLNFISLARGKERIEVYRREIALVTIRRAFALISLSLATIGVAVFAISWSDPDLGLLPIAFECFSAYSTVGLSLGITANLSETAKWIIILTMFVGRVSMLTILIALFRRFTHVKYRYPSEEILIN